MSAHVHAVNTTGPTAFSVLCKNALVEDPAWRDLLSAGISTLLDASGESFEVVGSRIDGNDVLLTIHDKHGPAVGAKVDLLPTMTAEAWRTLQALTTLAQVEVQGMLWRDEDDRARLRFYRACNEVFRVAKLGEAKSVIMEHRAAKKAG